MHTLYVTNLTFIVLLTHQEYLYSNLHWNKSLIPQWVLYITNECVIKGKKSLIICGRKRENAQFPFKNKTCLLFFSFTS